MYVMLVVCTTRLEAVTLTKGGQLVGTCIQVGHNSINVPGSALVWLVGHNVTLEM